MQDVSLKMHFVVATETLWTQFYTSGFMAAAQTPLQAFLDGVATEFLANGIDSTLGLSAFWSARIEQIAVTAISCPFRGDQIAKSHPDQPIRLCANQRGERPLSSVIEDIRELRRCVLRNRACDGAKIRGLELQGDRVSSDILCFAPRRDLLG